MFKLIDMETCCVTMQEPSHRVVLCDKHEQSHCTDTDLLSTLKSVYL